MNHRMSRKEMIVLLPQASNISSIFGRHKHSRRSVPGPIRQMVNCGMVDFLTGIDGPFQPAHHSIPPQAKFHPEYAPKKMKPPLHRSEESDHTQIPDVYHSVAVG